jgi:dolichol-phosphate mannosyltransferase
MSPAVDNSEISQSQYCESASTDRQIRTGLDDSPRRRQRIETTLHTFGSSRDPPSSASMRYLTALPVFNEEKYLDEVLPQVVRNAGDVLVVDDGSTDATPEILSRRTDVRTVRHPRNMGYGAALVTAFQETLRGGYDALVTIDCDGQHEPQLIPKLIESLTSRNVDIVSGSRYLDTYDPNQPPPEDRRRINMTVLGWLRNELNLNLTDAFCGFKSYRASVLGSFRIHDLGYAMPLEVWVQAVRAGMRIVEEPVPLIYLDASRSFGGSLDDSEYRLKHYRKVFDDALTRASSGQSNGDRDS